MPILLPRERIGTVIAEKYRLDSILGRGGMGVVFAGQHTGTGRPVAVKVLLPQYAEHDEVKHRFLTEARSAASIHHPNVVDVLDIGVAEDGSLYLVLEFLEGESLEDRLADMGRLGAEETLTVLLPIIDAVGKAHDAGIIHRDLKPPNIFLSRDGRGELVPKLLDFGVAKVTQTDPGGQTKTGSVVGTPHYMSPEQARGLRELGAAGDIWSMGVVVYECLTGQTPWDTDNVHTLLMQIVGTPPPPVTDLAPECPATLADAIHRCLSKEPSDRPPSALALALLLREAADACGYELGSVRGSTPSEPGVAARISAGVAATLPADLDEAGSTPAAATLDEVSAPDPRRTPWLWIAVASMVLLVGLAFALGGSEPDETTATSDQGAANLTDGVALAAEPPGRLTETVDAGPELPPGVEAPDEVEVESAVATPELAEATAEPPAAPPRTGTGSPSRRRGGRRRPTPAELPAPDPDPPESDPPRNRRTYRSDPGF
ncbi:MAG: serine/threonine protein kinase [Sandaracinaceae bacterium]